MSILVTGGAGYIGSCAVAALKEKGYEVVVVDNLSKGHKQAVGDVKLYIGSVGDETFMHKVFTENKIDAVMHFAAFSLVGESMLHPYEYYNNNVAQSMHLFHSMIEHGVKNVVFSSTAATYGEPEENPISEETPQHPINTYGQTKLAIEDMLKWFGVAYGLNSMSLRYFNVAGAHPSGNIGEDHNPETHLIPIILQVALGKREKLSVFGNDYPTKDGTCIRDYIHVMDLAQAHILAMEYMLKNNCSDEFNLGSGGGYSNLEILNAARKVTGCEIPSVFEDRRPGDPPVLVATSEKAERILGWHRQYGIEDIIASAFAWHKAHPNGYDE
ncbi:MAG: UDP-glucose 4-epimerase GalE [Clostridiales bacterium]|nr:UDP-glucose 4-epimerase GalE [Clostridiales bacterium]